MTKLLDLFAVLVVAVLLLLPQPSVVVSPAARGDKTDLERLAVLEDARFRTPEDAAVAVDLARAYLRVEQPGWAAATLAPFLGSNDYHVHQAAAFVYATLLMPKESLEQAEASLKACDQLGSGCPEVARIRLSYLADLMRQPAVAGVDPSTDPLKARQLVQQALRATRAPLPSPKPAAPTKAPTPTPAPSGSPGQGK